MSLINSFKQHKLKSVLIIILGLILFLMLFFYSNKVAPISWGLFGDVNNEDGIALQGGDAVAYYSEGKYVAGDKSNSYTGKNATWLFSSETNKKLFIASPEKYMPQYGGYCAFAVSKGVTAVSDPAVFTIQYNKLYVFNDDGVKNDWLDGINSGSITTSDENWASRI